ncbi:MAG TPA: DUF2306 domain-containing protein [Vicinamibacterales bacterium]|nr:DUF2306 domain-containing protein [Vicinamibacterales bacterium]
MMWFRAKYIAFLFVGAMTAYVLYHNEHFLIDRADPVWLHIKPFKWWLLPHGVAGACALLLAPLQFSERLRRRFTKVHRVVGRIYVGGVFVLAPLGVYIQYFEERLGESRSFTVLTLVDAALLVITTGVAFYFALQRRIPQHRQWMTRSYAVALVFFEGRFILGVTGWETRGSGVAETVIWTCLALSLLLADLANQWHDSRPIGARSPGAHARQPRVVAPESLGV